MLCYLYPEPTYFIFSSDAPVLLYYAHIPTVLIALFIGAYVFWNGRQFLLNRLLFAISVLFSIWTAINLILWTNTNGGLLVFVWSFLGSILSLIAVFCIYFVHVFLYKKDVSNTVKTVFVALLAPVVLLSSTSFNLSGFNITVCDAFEFEWAPYKIYPALLGMLAMVWILVLLVRSYRTSTPDFRKQIMFMGTGIELLLFLFFGMEFLAAYLVNIGLFQDSWLELYGMLGIVAFIIYINILIVRFKTFNIKLIATQALVWGLITLIGSQFFFIKEQLNFILNGITFVGSIVFGSFLIKSVKREIKQREELAGLNIQLKDLIKERENLVHLVTHKVKGSFTRSKYLFAGLLDGMFGEISPAVKKAAEQGLESDNMGIETVDLVLSVANMQKGIVKYEMKKMDLKELVLKTVSEKSVAAEAKGLKIETEIGDDKYNVSGDAFWLKEVINNLIENSIKYTTAGLIKVSLGKQGANVLFSVKDTGIGITEEDKKNLFTEGGRGKDSVKVNVDSTGYGLYSVKLIVEAHKGRVWAESEGEGKGSQFYVELPQA